jgi:hypothetical protein
MLEMSISGQERSTDLHSAGGNPDIVYWNLGTF